MPQEENDIVLRSEEVNDILSHIPPWIIRYGNLLFLALILLLIAMSWFITYPDVVTTEATLTTQIPPQKEYAKITGKIDTLLVVDKQDVHTGTVLAVLENTAVFNDVYLLKAIMDTLPMNKEQVYFPFDDLPLLFLGDIETDFAQFENAYFQYTLNKDLQPFSNEALANTISLAELKSRLGNQIAQRALSKAELAFKKKDLERNQGLYNKGIISAQDYENKELEYLNAQRNYQSSGVTVSQLREAVSNAENTSKGTEFNKTREDIRLLKNVLQAYNQLKKSIKDWELNYVFISNMEGKVSFLNYWNTNQTVNSGDLIFSVLPKANSPFVAKLKTPTNNAGKIQVGQTVNLSLFDYPQYEFGVLKGTVERISATSDASGIYIVDVAIPEPLVTSYDKPIVFKQEMKGQADI